MQVWRRMVLVVLLLCLGCDSMHDPFQSTTDPFQGANDPFKELINPFEGTGDVIQNTRNSFQERGDPSRTYNNRLRGVNDFSLTGKDLYRSADDLYRTTNDPYRNGIELSRNANDLYRGGNERTRTTADLYRNAGDASRGLANSLRGAADRVASSGDFGLSDSLLQRVGPVSPTAVLSRMASSFSRPTDTFANSFGTGGRCSRNACGGLYNQIASGYRSLFHSECDVVRMNLCGNQPSDTCPALPRRCRSDRENPGGSFFGGGQFPGGFVGGSALSNSDNDRCCATSKRFVPISGPRTDVFGNRCTVVSLAIDGNGDGDVSDDEVMFQIVRMGTCDTPGTKNVGGITCNCKVQQNTVTLLCIASGRPQFRLFNVDGYCSCQS